MIGRKGRPKNDRVKNNRVNARFSDEEIRMLDAICEDRDMKRSDVLRDLVRRSYDNMITFYENY